MKLSTRLITGALILSQLTLGLGTFVPPAAAQTAQVQAQELAPLSNNHRLSQPAKTPALLQKASQLRASLTLTQRLSIKAVLKRYTPQLKELNEQLKAATLSASVLPTQASEQLEAAPGLTQMQEVTGRLQEIRGQIESELSSVLSENQLQQYHAVSNPPQTDAIGYPTTCPTMYNGMAYSQTTYVYSNLAYTLEGGNVDAFWAGYNAQWAHNYAYNSIYYGTDQGFDAHYYANQAFLYAKANEQTDAGSFGDLAYSYASSANYYLSFPSCW